MTTQRVFTIGDNISNVKEIQDINSTTNHLILVIEEKEELKTINGKVTSTPSASGTILAKREGSISKEHEIEGETALAVIEEAVQWVQTELKKAPSKKESIEEQLKTKIEHIMAAFLSTYRMQDERRSIAPETLGVPDLEQLPLVMSTTRITRNSIHTSVEAINKYRHNLETVWLSTSGKKGKVLAKLSEKPNNSWAFVEIEGRLTEFLKEFVKTNRSAYLI